MHHIDSILDSLCIVSVSPFRYFSDMVDVMTGLLPYYKLNELSPFYVATMKQPYAFENAKEFYIELEKGDSFVLLRHPEGFRADEGTVFTGKFPTPEIIREAQWEKQGLNISIIRMDAFLKKQFRAKFEGVNFGMPIEENKWLKAESFTNYVNNTHLSQNYLY